MTYIVSGGALNSTHSLILVLFVYLENVTTIKIRKTQKSRLFNY